MKKKLAQYPVLQKIAFCESSLRQYDENGNVLRGIVDKRDVGLMQVNEYYHSKTAKALGLDLHTPEGNMEYAIYLYNKEGTKPWNSSKKCWSDGSEFASTK